MQPDDTPGSGLDQFALKMAIFANINVLILKDNAIETKVLLLKKTHTYLTWRGY